MAVAKKKKTHAKRNASKAGPASPRAKSKSATKPAMKVAKAVQKKPATLNAKQQLFVLEYIKDFNATRAAKAAGYSQKTAYSIGHELLNKPEIQAAIQEALKKRLEETRIDANWVLQRLVQEADADLADIYDENDVLRPIREWPKVWRTGLVVGLETEVLYEEDKEGNKVASGRTHKIRSSDRKSRIELIGKHVDVQAFKERVSNETPEGDPLVRALAEIRGQSIRPRADDEGAP
jgi:phage terminase small subunit